MKKFKMLIYMLVMIYSEPALAAQLIEYNLQSVIDLPGESGSTYTFDVLKNGKLTVLDKNFVLHVENNVLGFDELASFGLTGTPVFSEVSPNQEMIAISTYSEIYICHIALSMCIKHSAKGFSGQWIDDRYLLLSSSFQNEAPYSQNISVLDTQSPDPLIPQNITLVENLPGEVAALVFDSAMNLYAATYTTGGLIHYFSYDLWSVHFQNQTQLDFDTGETIGTLLTAGNFDFDLFGSLLVGGGNLVGTAKGLVVPPQILSNVIAGLLTPLSTESVQIQTLDAGDCPINFAIINADKAKGRIILSCYRSDTARIYEVNSINVPFPAAYVGILFLILLTVVQNRLSNTVD